MANSKDQTIADYYQNCPCCGRGDGLQLEADSVPWRPWKAAETSKGG